MQWSQNVFSVAYYSIWPVRYVFVSFPVKLTQDSQSFCPYGWIGFQNKCYYFSKEEGDWNSSKYNCSTQHADLTIIDNTEEMVSNLIYILCEFSWVRTLEIFKYHHSLEVFSLMPIYAEYWRCSEYAMWHKGEIPSDALFEECKTNIK